MNLRSQIEIQAYGTSEGVQKAWDTRGRHSEYGNFKRGGDITATASSINSKYVSGEHTVSVKEPRSGRGTAVIREYKGKDFDMTDKNRGPASGLGEYLHSRYGINHNIRSEYGIEPVRKL